MRIDNIIITSRFTEKYQHHMVANLRLHVATIRKSTDCSPPEFNPRISKLYAYQNVKTTSKRDCTASILGCRGQTTQKNK